jgi:lipopolysaccharide export system permease protein
VIILYRYVLKSYYKYVAATLFLCLFLFILFDFIHKTTSFFSRYNPSGGLIFRYYVYQIPFQLMQALPIAALFSGVVTMLLLSKGNEINAMRAIGMNARQIATPIMIGGASLSLFTALWSEYVLPISATHMHYIRHVAIEGESEWALENHSFWVRDGNRIIGFSQYNQSSRELEDVKILKVSPEFELKEAVHAARAAYDHTEKNWQFHEVNQLRFTETGRIDQVIAQETRKEILPVEPDKLRMEWRMPDEMGLRELSSAIAEGKQYGSNVLGYEVAWHVKLAFPFAAWIVSLLGIPFGYRSERRTETLKGVLLAFFIGMSYWFILSWFRALAVNGDVLPVIAAWAGNIILAVIVGWQMWNLEKAK